MSEAQHKKATQNIHIIWQLPKYNILQLILISLRLLPAASIMCFVLLFQNYIRPRIMIPAIRRYLSCLVNLICLRIILLLLGFFKFECENYQYFHKMARMMTFRSGWVGVASHQTIVDFLYYSYLFNPVYARIIEFIDDQNKVKLFYTPLSFNEAFLASLSYRGFDPIVLRGEQQFKRFKRRKMFMPTLISECFEETNGPILLFLPSLGLNQQLSLHEIVGHDMFDNQRRFLRSGIAFDAQIQQNKNNERIRPEFANKIYFNQLILMTELCKEFKVNTLTVIAIEMIKYKYEYTREIYSNFVNQMYQTCKITTLNLSFSDYLTIFNDKEKEQLEKDDKQNRQLNENNKTENKKQTELAKEDQSEQDNEEEMGLDKNTLKIE